jgi:hypothetical protein
MVDELASQPKANAPMGGPVIQYVLVDHENVQPTDIGLLDRADVRVFVFVGAQQGKLSSDLAIRMHNLGERAKYVRASAVGANALDFHIAFYIGRLATKDARGFFHVISKDKGYDPLLAHLKEQGISGARSESIKAMPLFKSPAVAARPPTAKKLPPASEPSVKPKVAASTPGRVRFIVEPEAPKISNLTPVIPVKPPVVSLLSLPLADAKTTAQRWTKLRSGLKKMEGNRPSTMAALKKHVGAQFNGDKVAQGTADALIAGLIKFGLLAVTSDNKLTWHADKF